MFKDCWPQVSRSVVDDRGHKKIGFEALKESMNPTLVNIEWKHRYFKPGQIVEVPIFVINDDKDLVSTNIIWKIYDHDDLEKKSVVRGNFFRRFKGGFCP